MIVNNKKEVVDIASKRPIHSSEGNYQNRRSTKPSKPPLLILLHSQKSKEGLLEESTYPRKLLVGLFYKCKHYINCNSLLTKQKTAKTVEKTKRMPEKMVTFRDNFRLYQQERSIELSLSCEVMLTAGMEMYKEEDVMDSVLTACNGFAVKLSPQSSLAKCICLMVYSCSNEVCNVDVDMTDAPLVYGPLSSFIDRDNEVDLELACLSNMSITVVFVSNINIHPVLSNFISNLFGLKKRNFMMTN